jgi:hypothetical protein
VAHPNWRGRIRLAVGPSAMAWLAYAILVALTLPFWIVPLSAISGLGPQARPFVWLVLVASLVLCGAIAWLGVKLYRSAYWLDGTVLVQRRVRGWRRVDLSTAKVDAEAVAPSPAGVGQPLPQLVAQQPGHEPIRLWLRDPDRRSAPLPPGQLLALAAAITHGRGDDPQARRIADALRGMAHDPYDLGH